MTENRQRYFPKHSWFCHLLLYKSQCLCMCFCVTYRLKITEPIFMKFGSYILGIRASVMQYVKCVKGSQSKIKWYV